MKSSKPRNYVLLALLKRSSAASGAHVKPHKAKRVLAKRQLAKELKKPPMIGGFLLPIYTSVIANHCVTMVQ